ncbi:MAG: DUF4832 domain-containing protein [Candidatus Cryptobacteroides sp.]
MKRTKYSICLGIVLSLGFLSFLCSCSDEEGGNGSGDFPENTLVKPSYSKTRIIKNPLCGWVMYGSRSADDTYWDTEYYVQDLGKNVKVRDYASACYIRTSWSSLNPQDGVYVWDQPDSRLYKLIKGAEERGLPIAFRVVVDGRDQGANTPQFVYDAGAKYAVENSKYPDRTTPMPQDPVFQQYYEKFVEAFAKEFNDPDKTAFIDGYGLGKWGEGHTVAYDPDNVSKVDENTERLKEEVLDWITKLYAKHFTKVPLVINYHHVLAHPTSSGTTGEISNKLVSIAVSNGYCLRSDAFGMNSYYTSWEKACAATWRFKRPIIMEGGWIVGQHSYWNDPAGYRQGHPEDVRQGEYDASKEAHVNMMDFRAGDETGSWFTTSFGLVEQFIQEGGYRVYPDQVSVPAKLKSGSEVQIVSRWRNMGWGYLPNNIPQWNYKYKVAFALLDASGKAVKIYVDEACEPSEWVDSKAFPYTFETVVDAPAGNYTWAVAIVDRTKDDTPGIELAVNNEMTDEGWVKILPVVIE